MPALAVDVLNQAIVDGLGDLIVTCSPVATRPLDIAARAPLPSTLRIYTWTISAPPGGRPADEHKIQLIVPGQIKGERGNFDWSGDPAVMVAGYDQEHDVVVLWDATKYVDFGYSRNVQVPGATIAQARTTGEIATHERRVAGNQRELIIAAPREKLAEAVTMRFDASPAPVPATPTTAPRTARSRGQAYRRTTPNSPAPGARIFERDPDAIDRSTQAHAQTQHALSDVVVAAGHTPLSPASGDPQFDIAWIDAGIVFVAEVKSLSDTNEEKQIRLAIGQVLTYAYRLDWDEVESVQPVIALEKEPIDSEWLPLCAHYGIKLVWPATFVSTV